MTTLGTTETLKAHTKSTAHRGERLYPGRSNRIYWHLTCLRTQIDGVIASAELPRGLPVVNVGDVAGEAVSAAFDALVRMLERDSRFFFRAVIREGDTAAEASAQLATMVTLGAHPRSGCDPAREALLSATQ